MRKTTHIRIKSNNNNNDNDNINNAINNRKLL